MAQWLSNCFTAARDVRVVPGSNLDGSTRFKISDWSLRNYVLQLVMMV